MMSDVAFVVFHYPMADLFWVSCKCTRATHIYQNTCGYNFRTHGATLCPISGCPSRSLAFILVHNFSSLLRKHFGSFSVSYPLTCYTPHPVSLLDKSGDDRVRNNPLWYLALLLAQGKFTVAPYGRTHMVLLIGVPMANVIPFPPVSSERDCQVCM